MKTKHAFQAKRRGFTIVELLVVISIIAVVAAMATGAAVKSMRKVRERKIDAMATALEMALQNYRARENAWPFKLSQMTKNKDTGDYWAYSNKNYVVFQEMLNSSTKYLDTSSLTTSIKGRMSVQKAVEKDLSEIPIGYPDSADASKFHYFNVQYYPLTDRVKVKKEGDNK